MRLISDIRAMLAVGGNGSHQEMARAVRAAFERSLPGATASAGAATLNALAGKVTSEALTTAQDGLYTLTITNSEVSAGDIVMASVANGTNTQGTPTVQRVQPGAGQIVVVIANAHASAQALNGTLVVSFTVLKAA